MDSKKTVLIIHEHSDKGLSQRTLAKKYKVSKTTVSRIIMAARKQVQQEAQAKQDAGRAGEGPMPEDVTALKEALRIERLKNELLNAVIDLSGKELGVDLRKKYGTGQ